MIRSNSESKADGQYYRESLSGVRLERCYRIAPPRVRQYLDAEIDYTVRLIGGASCLLELGCGYGRVMRQLAGCTETTVGIDTSWDNLRLACRYLEGLPNCRLVCADAGRPGLADRAFDAVICIQNGISAFHLDTDHLVRETLRLVRPGGLAVFSTYAAAFWDHRLEWFERQSAEGLIGPIDYSATHDGRIRCLDGFTATTIAPDFFQSLTQRHRLDARVEEVDGSSVFWVVRRGS